jgi:cohesin complex subunit SA-1/2
MDLHILFGATVSAVSEDQEMDANPMTLILDDEAQYRCAGFIQAEIERFKDHLEEVYPSAEADDSAGSDGDGSETEAPSKKQKKPKTKKQKTKTTIDTIKCALQLTVELSA